MDEIGVHDDMRRAQVGRGAKPEVLTRVVLWGHEESPSGEKR